MQRPDTTEARSAVSMDHLRDAEKMLLALMIDDRQCIAKVKESLRLQELTDECTKSVIELLFDLHSKGEVVSPSKIINFFDPGDEASKVVTEASAINEIIKDRSKVMKDCLEKIKTNYVNRQLSKLQGEIRSAHQANDEPKLRELVVKYNQLIKTKHAHCQ